MKEGRSNPSFFISMINEQTRQFIRQHRYDDVSKLALHTKSDGELNLQQAISQIDAWQIARKKIPSWAKLDDIIYPQHISMEQCSSETTAAYKATLAQGDTLVDLTAGLGVDFSFMAPQFQYAHYVEQQQTLCRIAEHNFSILGLNNTTVNCMTAEEFLRQTPHVSCIFIDPSRRDARGSKTIRIEDCKPDISKLLTQLTEKADNVIVKLSPMLDITAAINDLKIAQEIHVVAVDNECKELLIVINSANRPPEPTVKCVNIGSKQPTFNFQLSTEHSATWHLADNVETYLYEPNAAIMKAAPFKLLSQRYNLKKLAPNSHLYTSDNLIPFPGRTFHVEAVSGFSKKELKAFLSGLTKANLAVRNFPSSAEELKKKLKLKDGGDTYIFATSLLGGDKALIKTNKVED